MAAGKENLTHPVPELYLGLCRMYKQVMGNCTPMISQICDEKWYFISFLEYFPAVTVFVAPRKFLSMTLKRNLIIFQRWEPMFCF